MNLCTLNVEVHFHWEMKDAGKRYVPVCYLDGYPIALDFDLIRLDQATLDAVDPDCLFGELKAGDWCVRGEFSVPVDDYDDYHHHTLDDFLSRDGSVEVRAMERFFAHAVSTQIHTLRQTASTAQGEAREGRS